MLNNRVYDCFRCANRNLCKNNNVVMKQCADSIKSQMILMKADKERYLKVYKARYKNLKKKYRQRIKN